MSSKESLPEANHETLRDVEKADAEPVRQRTHAGAGAIFSRLVVEDGEVYERHPESNPKWYQRLLDAGVEENGIKPVPVAERTNTQYSNLFTVFFSGLLCILPIPTGILATTVFGMSLRDSALVIIFFSLLTCIPPAFMGIGGMWTGLRQLIQARYSFGLYLVTIPLLLNAATVTGFSLVSALVAGQTIAALNPASVSVNVGIVIICLVSFGASLLGYRALHLWERWTWIPNLVALLVTVGCGGQYLHMQASVPAASAPQVLSYGGLIAGYFMTFGGTASDYTTYHKPASRLKVFAYIYLGLFLPSVPLLILGAAMGGVVPNIPAWSDAYGQSGVGGVMYQMLVAAGGFGKFVMVLLALSVTGNIAISMYSVALNLQMLLPLFARVPRFLFMAATTAIMIPMAIAAAAQWETSLENFLAVIGYWAGCFDAVVIIELVAFRRLDYATFDHAIWNVGRRLPTGLAAMGACLLSMGLVVPGIAEVWFTGPIAATTGDIGFEMAFVVTALAYLPLRWLEIRWRGHL